MSTEHEVQALFRAEQAVRPAAAALEQGWQRLALDLAADVAPLPIAMGAVKLNSWLVSKWLAAGFAIGAVGLGASAQLLTPAPAPGRANAPRVARHVARSAQPRSVQPGPATTTDAEAAPSAPSAAPSARESHAVAPKPSASTRATFDEELALITLAKRDLDAHHLSQASALLSEHAASFPGGVFAVEREALQILVACERGPKNEALARAFATRHPSSPLVERLQGACRSNVDFSSSANGNAAAGGPTAEPSKGQQQ